MKLKALIFSVIISFIAYGLWIFTSEYEAVMSSMRQLGLWGFVWICTFSLLNYLLRFLRWQYLITLLKHQIPTGRHCFYYLAGFALTTTPGKAGEAVRSVYLKPHGVNYTDSLAALFTERLSDFLAIALLALGTLWLFPDYKAFGISIVLCIGLFTLLLQTKRFSTLTQTILKIIPIKKIRQLGQHLITLIEQTRTLIGYKAFINGLLLGVTAWGLEAYAFGWMIQQLGYDHPYWLLGSIYALSTLVGALSFIPGGLGSTELVMALLLASLSMTQADITSATLLCRLATLWLAVIIGLLAMGYLAILKQQKVTDTT